MLFVGWEFFSHFPIHHLLTSHLYLTIVTAAVIGSGATAFTFALFAVIERMQRELVERNRRVAVLEERERIALEMHDGFAQVLGGIAARLKAIGELAGLGRVSELAEHTGQVEQVVQEAYTDVREYILGLKTPVAQGRGFWDALSEFLHGFRLQHRLPVELVGNDTPPRLPLTAEVQLIRIIQEALSNVRKHSGADHAWVRFEHEPGTVRVTIQDNGRGFDPAQVEGRLGPHFGLNGMRERAEGVGGRLEVFSRPGEGTRVVVLLPAEGARKGER